MIKKMGFLSIISFFSIIILVTFIISPIGGGGTDKDIDTGSPSNFELTGEIAEDTLRSINLLPKAAAAKSWVEFKGDLNTGKIYAGQGSVHWYKGDQSLYTVGDGGSTGGIVTRPGALGALDWAAAIANDDSFFYGAGEKAHRGGCYFCNTNVRKKGKGYEKTYCCNPFVFSAYAHGANDAKMLETCRKGGNAATKFENFGFKKLGKISWAEVENGDVLKTKSMNNHFAMVYDKDNDLLVEAHSHGTGADEYNCGPKSIQITDGARKRANKSVVYRYYGNGPGGTVINADCSGVSGGGGAQGAVSWAKAIADDDSYTYKMSNRCHACHPSASKTYCCAAFVVAAYAHGAGDSKIQKLCASGNSARVDSMMTNLKKTGMFSDIGPITQGQMQPGDVLIYSSKEFKHAHTELYYGNGQEVGAHSTASGISVRKQGSSGQKLLTVLRYKGSGGSSPVNHKEYKKHTVVKTFNTNNVDVVVPKLENSYLTAQSMAYVGNGQVAVLTNDTQGKRTGRYGNITIYDENGKQQRRSGTLTLWHGNGLTCKEGTLYVTSGSQHKTNGRKVDSETLGDKGEISYKWNTQGIGYDRATGNFVTSTKNSIDVADSELNTKKVSFHKLVGGMCQDIGAYGGVVYACTSEISMYDEESGKYYGSYKLGMGGELESCDIDDQGRLLFIIHRAGGTDTLYRTKEAVATAEVPLQNAGQGISGLTVREDIRVNIKYKKENARIRTLSVAHADGFTPTEENLRVANVIAKALAQRGYSQAGIAGVLGNIHGESGMRPDAIEGGSGAGHGLCQWSFGRWTNLQKFARYRGKDWTDLNVQVEFLCHELDSYSSMERKLKTVTDVAEATAIFMKEFERPGVLRTEARIRYANGYYGKTTGSVGSGVYTKADVSVHIDLTMMKAVVNGTFNGMTIEGLGDVTGSFANKKVEFSLTGLAANGNTSAIAGMIDSMRTQYPESGNKWYFDKSINPFPRNASGGNCTWYAYGRFCEIAGRKIPMSEYGDAVTFYNSFPSCQTGKTPRVGAIICWGYGGAHGHPGHVAVVEEVKANGDIVCSNSGWSGERFWMSEHSAADNYSMHHNGDVFRGFIYNPGVMSSF